MNKEDLIKGEIYTYCNGAILKWNGFTVSNYLGWNAETNLEGQENINSYSKTNGGFSFGKNTINQATPEEKHWLNKCIELDKFITKDEAMKSFIPEYVECINNENTPYGIIGRVYKFENVSRPHWKVTCNLTCDGYEPGSRLYFNIEQLKPSTKEAYDEQNKFKFEVGNKFEVGKWYSYSSIGGNGVIFNNLRSKVLKVYNNCLYHVNEHYINSNNEYTLGTYININILSNIKELDVSSNEIQQYLPDNHPDKVFVLPEKWCINMENFNEGVKVAKFIKKNHWYLTRPNGVKYFNFINNDFSYWSSELYLEHKEITFEQFKKYVLKEDNQYNPNESKTIINNIQMYSLQSIEESLLKDYDKTDVKDIMKTLNKYLK